MATKETKVLPKQTKVISIGLTRSSQNHNKSGFLENTWTHFGHLQIRVWHMVLFDIICYDKLCYVCNEFFYCIALHWQFWCLFDEITLSIF